jgi:hypothetical protein
MIIACWLVSPELWGPCRVMANPVWKWRARFSSFLFQLNQRWGLLYVGSACVTVHTIVRSRDVRCSTPGLRTEFCIISSRNMEIRHVNIVRIPPTCLQYTEWFKISAQTPCQYWNTYTEISTFLYMLGIYRVSQNNVQTPFPYSNVYTEISTPFMLWIYRVIQNNAQTPCPYSNVYTEIWYPPLKILNIQGDSK